REALAIEVDLNLPAPRVTRVLDSIAANRGYPAKPEFISLVLAGWAEKHGVTLEFIQPGKPTQNSFIERFNRTYRNEILDFYLFRNLNEVRDITEKWMKEYNEERPHESLGDLSPFEYRLIKNKPVNSSLGWH
ncbi:TPA: integrase core domain-containing protein, partial [Legionella pneumophila]